MNTDNVQDAANVSLEVLLRGDVGIVAVQVHVAIVGPMHHKQKHRNGDAGDDGVHVGGTCVCSHELDGGVGLEGLEGKQGEPDSLIIVGFSETDHGGARVESEDVGLALV